MSDDVCERVGSCLCVFMDKLELLNFTRRLYNEDLLYCVYGGLEMGRHDSFAHKALHPSSWTVVFVRVPR